MQRFLTYLLLLAPLLTGAQTLNPSDYIWPLPDVEGLYAANFGEMRPNHFHSGVDIKTDGVEGKRVVAVAGGYVSRVLVNPTGFGRALFITHPNGTTSVYGHLSQFRDDIQAYVHTAQMRAKSNKIDLQLTPDQFPVRQGDAVAFSGNAGISFGPHLHFELRTSANQRALNIVRQGVIRPDDDIPPTIVRIHYIETDTVRGTTIYREPITYEVSKSGKSAFRLSRRTPVEIGRSGYFVVEATDRRNGVNNTFGLYRATLQQDGKPLFEYRIDGFTPDRSRDCNAASYYPLQLDSKNEVIRLGAIEGANPEFHPICVRRGTVGAAEGETHDLRIEVEDDCGNTSLIEFPVVGRTPWLADIDPLATLCDRRRTTTLTTGDARMHIPAGALYESLLVRPGLSSAEPARDGSLPVLSPVYRFLDRTVPLKSEVEASIAAQVPTELQARATLGALAPNGRIEYIGGRYKQGRVTARTTTTGDLVVVADTVPPAVRPLFASGSDLSKARGISFRISDSFSGIASCELTIDGEWALCDRLPIKGTATHLFDRPRTGKRHTIRLTVCDACGNKTQWEGAFVR